MVEVKGGGCQPCVTLGSGTAQALPLPLHFRAGPIAPCTQTCILQCTIEDYEHYTLL